jgi:hypothetical protein
VLGGIGNGHFGESTLVRIPAAMEWGGRTGAGKPQRSSILDRTHVPNLHIIMRRRLLGQMMAVTLRQLVASTSSILWGFPSIIEIISVRKFKIRLISEVLISVGTYDNTNKEIHCF